MFKFDNSYARLPAPFHAHQAPTPVAAPRLIALNEPLARDLSLDPSELRTAEGIATFAGNSIPEGAASIAMAYAGHQFGHFVPQLGDGRAILLGEVIDQHGQHRDIQLKGAGPTPFSRRGDGRAALGPVLREYIMCEAMHALGVPSTRALAAVTTGETIIRETILPGAIFTRVASSHIRVGTFQFFAARNDHIALQQLADYVIRRHYPSARDTAHPYRSLLDQIITRQAHLIAKWLQIGFIHGVMNTDNMSIAGETIDYGPCAFMDFYHPDTVYSSIDRDGRYAYGNQPGMAHWNLARLAETFIPLLNPDQDKALEQAQSALNNFAPQFEQAYAMGMCQKIGLQSPVPEDFKLVQTLLKLMQDDGTDFTLSFRTLCDAADGNESPFRQLFTSSQNIDNWLTNWKARLKSDAASGHGAHMRAINPAFIPRNHLVEDAIQAAQKHGDFSTFETLNHVLENPFKDQPIYATHALPPRPDQVVHKTFCGT